MLAVGIAKMYNLAMTSIPATEARQKWAQTLESAQRGPVVISQHGRDSVVIMQVDTARRALEALEEAEEATSIVDALAEIDSRVPTVRLEDIAAELGITLD